MSNSPVFLMIATPRSRTRLLRAALQFVESSNLDDKMLNLTPLTELNQVLLSRDKPLLPLLMTLPVRNVGPITARLCCQRPMSGGKKCISQSGRYTITSPVDGFGHDIKTQNQDVIEV